MSNTEVDALCRRAEANSNPHERLNLFAQAEDQILEDAPWVPISFAREALFVREGVTIRTNLFGYLPHTKTKL